MPFAVRVAAIGSWWRRRRALCALCFGICVNAVSIANIFPYAPFMVRHLGMTEDERELGFYAGFLMSAYQLGNLLTNYHLGAFADSYGRKPVLLLGLLSCTLPQVVFGLSPTYAFALAARFVMALPNAMVAVAKAVAPELVGPEEQGMAMSLISGMWGLGNMLGPAIGGLLSETGPPDSFLGRFPYLLPNLVTAVFAVLATIDLAFHLPGLPPPLTKG